MIVRLAFNTLAILGSGVLAGVLLTIGLSFGAYWQSLQPAAFLDWFAANMGFVPRAVPPALIAAALGLAGSLWLSWGVPRERWLWAAALLCIVMMLGITLVWNAPLNGRFANGDMAPTEVPGALRVWLTAHAVRITLVMTATVLGIVAAQR